MKGLATGTASFAWSAASWGARLAARRGLLRSESLDAGRVVSIGNIQAGGSGKTPLVARVANEARARGKSVCILCRGYGAEWETRGGLLAPNAPCNALECGDEAALLRGLAPDAWIAVGADRVRQYARAIRAAGRAFDLVVLDDGFQHWRIRKDLEVVALTSHGPSEVLHRDFRAALGSADLVVWTKGRERPETFDGLPMVRAKFALPRAEREGMPVWLVSGVGDPESVAESAREAAYRVDRHLVFRDHAVYEAGMLRDLIERSREAGARVATTGKDWVKWRELGIAETEVIVLEPEVSIEEADRPVWEKVLWKGERWAAS
ncbi:MAG TPA: tetraacyldisaccharide 4'-kinase [Bdellovibrionota bacterium]|nr:tetraacyldisaccharide 4'-kinase [Bdellovibrionota bacterium]